MFDRWLELFDEMIGTFDSKARIVDDLPLMQAIYDSDEVRLAPFLQR